MKTISLDIRQKLAQKAALFSFRNALDWVLVLELIGILGTIFLKVYVSGLYVNERSRAEKLKGQIKVAESETKKIRMELSRYKDRENLRNISVLNNHEENIEVVVVR